MAVPLPLHHKVNHPEVAALDDQRAAGGGEGLLLHRRYVVVQYLHTARDGGERNRRKALRFSSGLFALGAYANVASS